MIEQATMLITNIRTMFAQQQNYADLNNSRAVNLQLVPEEMIGAKNNGEQTLHNSFSGNVVIAPSPISEDDVDNEAFKVTFYDIPKEACVSIATTDWGSDSGLLGMHIWNAENDDTTEPDYDMDNMYSESYVSNNEHFFTPNSVPISVINAIDGCSCDNKSTCAITWKYY